MIFLICFRGLDKTRFQNGVKSGTGNIFFWKAVNSGKQIFKNFKQNLNMFFTCKIQVLGYKGTFQKKIKSLSLDLFLGIFRLFITNVFFYYFFGTGALNLKKSCFREYMKIKNIKKKNIFVVTHFLIKSTVFIQQAF